MTKVDSEIWVEGLERALGPLVESVTGERWGGPQLSNAQYRKLGALANVDPNARAAFYACVPNLDADPSELVDLLSQHPVIRQNSDGAGKDRATFVMMPNKGFRMKLGQMDYFLTRSAVKRGCRETVALFERLLTLSSKNRVPGYEIAVFRELTMPGEVQSAPGLESISYQRAVARGLVRNDPPLPEDPPPGYVGMGALGLAREMTWGPCLVPPKKSTARSSFPKPKFLRYPECRSRTVFDLLSSVTSHRVKMMSVLVCAPEFVDVNSSFDPGSCTEFFQNDRWAKKNLT